MCPVIPIEQHPIYYYGANDKLLKDMPDLRSPKYALDSAMCYAKLKIIVEKTPTKTCIIKFRKSSEMGECSSLL